MIMKIAVAKDGFIDTKDSPTFSGTENFIECLEKIFTFEEKDLMEFDGNTCQFINSYNPTNSIFIYTNQQGTFLYTITDATPRVHKNNFIWNCNCYKMEDVAEINNILTKKTFVNLIKNKFPTKFFYNLVNDNKAYFRNEQPTFTTEIKNNFRTMCVERLPIAEELGLHNGASYVYYTLKIKCAVNPNPNNPPFNNLTTKSSDGSFNFYFPFILFPTNSSAQFAKMNVTTTLKFNSNTIKLDEIIKQYSTNIKSIELLPFFFAPEWSPKSSQDIANRICEVEQVVNSEGVWTDCGLFSPYSTSIKNDGITLCSQTLYLLYGGGTRGFVKTPLGNIELSFDTFPNVKNLLLDTNNIKIFVKEDGWFIGGCAKATIPPHYLNYYTDETGQLFIANMTTNAQELRQINRDSDYKKTQMGLNQTESLLSGIIGNAFAGNIGGIIGTIGNTALGVATELAKADVDYNKAIADYNDKQKTQELLASMSGKTISGNVSFFEMMSYFDNNYFEICLEHNYYMQKKENSSSIPNISNYFYITQKDYDYSVQFKSNQVYSDYSHYPTISEDDLVANNNIVYNPNGTTSKVCLTVADMVALLFGYSIPSGRIYNIDFSFSIPPTIHMNYSIVFNLINFDEATENFSQVLNFNIRK